MLTHSYQLTPETAPLSAPEKMNRGEESGPVSRRYIPVGFLT